MINKQQLKINHRKSNFGFTIIELSVVIVVIGILASLVVVTGNSYLKRAAESSARTTLISAASEVKKTFNRQGEYPLLPPIPSTIKIPSRISLTAVNNSSDRQSFCITARVSNYSDIQYYMNQTTSQPQSGACAG